MTSPFGGAIVPVGMSVGATSAALPISGIGSTSGTAGTQATQGGESFASVLASSLDQLQGAQSTADNLAVQAATGDLKDVHDYMIAANEASLATEMVVTIKNKAVEAFNEIMRMPV